MLQFEFADSNLPMSYKLTVNCYPVLITVKTVSLSDIGRLVKANSDKYITNNIYVKPR